MDWFPVGATLVVALTTLFLREPYFFRLRALASLRSIPENPSILKILIRFWLVVRQMLYGL